MSRRLLDPFEELYHWTDGAGSSRSITAFEVMEGVVMRTHVIWVESVHRGDPLMSTSESTVFIPGASIKTVDGVRRIV